MKAEDISNALNEINEEYIESANERRKTKVKKSGLIKWVSAAAAIAVVVLIGTKVFVPNTPEGNDEPVGEVGGTETEYGAYLPILEYIESNTTAYGFEGYMAYDISELSSGNPWNEEMVFEALPVYRNNSFNEIGIAYPGIGEEAMNKKLENIAEKTDLKMRGIIGATYVGDFSSGSGIPDDFITDIKADFGSYTIEIQSNGSIVAMYNGFDGEELPEEYSFTHNNTTEGEAFETIAYLYENYGDIIGLPEATFVTSKEYTFSGEEIRDYRIYDFSGDEINDMLNFAFNEVQLAPNDEGKLMLIRINDKLSCAEKIGDYPIISPEEAKDMLLEGGYITTVPYEMPGKKYIAKCELIYRSGISENIWMPYYRFLVELPEMAQENGLKNFGAYYVPAVKLEYIEGLPLWNGSFN
ncbi:MAG: hypothetical protein II254_01010 [Oscillospiraceae bacterium]|nr:hypothetical protein [Oscillospiraceae bacterium]